MMPGNFSLLVLHYDRLSFSAYSDYRLNSLFFIVFAIIGNMYDYGLIPIRSIDGYLGIYWIQNLITAVVYRAFRGYFLTSIINSQLRRRVATQASFEVLRKRISQRGSYETRYVYQNQPLHSIESRRDTVPICIVQTVVNAVSMSQWHLDRIREELSKLNMESEVINLNEYFRIMQLLDLNPSLASVCDESI